LRQALDTAGALLGPLADIALMAMLNDDVRAVFWVAVLPAVAAVSLLVFGVEEPTQHVASLPRLEASFGLRELSRVEKLAHVTLPHWRDLRRLGGTFWAVVAISAVLRWPVSAKRFCCGTRRGPHLRLDAAGAQR
jgi:hypothetical protein